MAYTFDQIFAADPSNPGNVAANGVVTIFAPGDATQTPLSIMDTAGNPLANPVTVNANGYGDAFSHATLDRVAWAGGGFSGFFTSYEGLKDEAVAARAAAEEALGGVPARVSEEVAAVAATGAFKGDDGRDGANVIPTDQAVADAITTPGTPANTALNATFVNLAGIEPMEIAPTDHPWIEITNGGAHSTIHLTTQPTLTAPYLMGIGKDHADKQGLVVSNKASGHGVNITNTPAVTGGTGSAALLVASQSTAAPGAAFLQMVDNAAPALEVGVLAGTATAGQKLQRWFTAGAHLAGDISAFDGTLRWIDPVSFSSTVTVSDQTATGAPAKLTVTDPRTNAAIAELSNDPTDLVNWNMSVYRATGGGTYWGHRLRASNNHFQIQVAPAAAMGSHAYNTAFSASMEGSFAAVGFFGITPTSRKSVLAAATDPATTMALVNDLRAKLIEKGLIG